jgi:hypothetical protein
VISPDGERGQWLGTYNQVDAFSSLAGDLVGGVRLALYGFTLTYAVLAAITVGAAIPVLLALRENPGGRKDPEGATGVFVVLYWGVPTPDVVPTVGG